MCPPVLLLIFNRPDKALRVFEQIRNAKPQRLFIAADGPRKKQEAEQQLCTETRTRILEKIDWDCEVHTLFRTTNLGCKIAVSTGISWFFKHVEEGIILEDDCLPELSFFRFCGELLEKYREHQQIMMISGVNFQPKKCTNSSYYFSTYLHIWGWATWRRAWDHYDLTMQAWPEFKEKKALYTLLPKEVAKRRELQFDRTFSGNTSTWDTQWLFAVWNNNGLSIQSNINQVINIDAGGTHTKVYDPCIMRPSSPMEFPLEHPDQITAHKDADLYTYKYIALRNWKRTLLLIIQYIFRTALHSPAKLPREIQTITLGLLSEIKKRF